MRSGLGGPVRSTALAAVLIPSPAGAVVATGTCWKRIEGSFGASAEADREKTTDPESADD